MKFSLNNITKNRILIKVYTIWFLKRVLPLVLIEIGALVFGLMVFARNVFVSKVLQNIGIVSEQGYWTVFKYLFYSFAKTHFVVQVVIIIVLGIGALILRDILRAIMVYLMTLKRRQDK